MKKGTNCTTGRKLTPAVLRLVNQVADQSGTDVDELMPLIKGVKATRTQVIRCLHNLKEKKMIVMLSPPKSIGGIGGSRPARYGRLQNAEHVKHSAVVFVDEDDSVELPLTYCTKPRGILGGYGRVASVWELGQR